MTDYTVRDIRIVGDLPIQELLYLKIAGRINGHISFTCRGIISLETAEKTPYHQTADKTVRVFLDGKVIFCGIITNVQVQIEKEVHYLSIDALSTTYLLDVHPVCRSFQDLSHTYLDVFTIMSKKSEQPYVLQVNAKAKAKLTHPLLQYQETDWHFIRRIASGLGIAIKSGYQSETPSLSVGCTSYSVEEISATARYVRKNHVGSLADFTVYENMLLSLGGKVRFLGFEKLITEQLIEFKNGKVEISYVLSSEFPYLVDKDLPNLRGLALPGTLLDRKAQMLKVHLDIDAAQEKKKAFWFPFRPDTGNGMYAMPPIGSRVLLEWASATGQDMRVIHSLRDDDGELPNEYSQRYFTTEYGHKLGMLPNSLFLCGNESNLNMDDGTGVYSGTSGRIRIYAHGDINILANRKVKISSMEQTKITKTGVKSGIEVSGGQMNVYSEDVIVYGNPNGKQTPPIPVYKMKSTLISTALAAKALGMIPKSGGKSNGEKSGKRKT